MSTQSPDRRVQLRNAIDALPAAGRGYLTRERVKDEGDVRLAIMNELSDVQYRLDVLTSAVSSYKEGYNDDLTTGIYVLAWDIKDTLDRMRELVKAMPEVQS